MEDHTDQVSLLVDIENIDTARKKLEQLEYHLKNVKKLIGEVNAMELDLKFKTYEPRS